MLVQGTLDSANNVVIPSKPLVWVDMGSGGGGGGPSEVEVINTVQVEVANTVTVAGEVEVTNTVAVTGPLDNAQYTAVTGDASATAWSGTGNGTLISILKALHAQNEEIKTLLEDIKTNTTPEP